MKKACSREISTRLEPIDPEKVKQEFGELAEKYPEEVKYVLKMSRECREKVLRKFEY